VNGRLGDRLFAELEGLLDDGAVDVAGGDAFGGGIVFVEADDLYLAGLTGGADGVENRSNARIFRYSGRVCFRLLSFFLAKRRHLYVTADVL
jgi:hypothetical protein